MGKGILVDAAGYFVGAYQWSAEEPTPDFNAIVAGNNKLGAAQRLILLKTPEAIAGAVSGGRWHFKQQKWESPTERRWAVSQRRDTPGWWFPVGSHLVWPDRLPALPEGQKWIDVAPPEVGRGRRCMWDDASGEWLTPFRAAVVNEEGVITNFATCYGGKDIPEGAFDVIDLDTVQNGKSETGEFVPPKIGDRIDTSGDGPVAEILRLPKYRKVSIDAFQVALGSAGMADDFTAFLRQKDIEPRRIRALETISLRNNLLREFVSSMGIPMSVAYKEIQQAAERIDSAEAEAFEDLAGEVKSRPPKV